MADWAELRAAKKRAFPVMLARPGVHGVGIGIKTVGGKPTGELVIIVLVEKKKDPHQISPSEMIPKEFDGIKTDVQEVPRPIAHQAATPDTAKERPLLGGTQIATPSAYASLGCFGTIQGRTNQVFGLTNCHVPAAGKGIPMNANVVASSGGGGTTAQIVISTSSGATITPRGATLVVDVRMADDTVYNFLVQTTTNLDTPVAVAQELVQRINALGVTAFQASLSGTTVSITTTLAVSFIEAKFYSIGTDYRHPELEAAVGVGQIKFTGSASSANYGIFVAATASGRNTPTGGAFITVQKDQSLSSIASDVAKALSDMGVPATSVGNAVNAVAMDHIECYVVNEVRVGQSEAQYASECCDWCADTIGTFDQASYELDAALIKLEPGLKYRAEVKDIGFIQGFRELTATDVTNQIAIRMRGRTTHGTLGNVISITTDGVIAGPIDPKDPRKGEFGLRCYIDAVLLRGDPGIDISDHGDSGSVWLDGFNVVALNFGGGRDKTVATNPGFAWATPIKPILDRFNLTLVTAQANGIELEVPKETQASSAKVEARASFAPVGGPSWRRRVDEIERNIQENPAGRLHLEIFRRHVGEAITLVNHNRRVGVAWQRNGGPVLIKAVLRMVQHPESCLPTQIMGRPFDECLEGIWEAFSRDASPSFVSDLERVIPLTTGLGGTTYAQFLERLQRLSEAKQSQAGSASQHDRISMRTTVAPEAQTGSRDNF